jgi:hypothetical protein
MTSFVPTIHVAVIVLKRLELEDRLYLENNLPWKHLKYSIKAPSAASRRVAIEQQATNPAANTVPRPADGDRSLISLCSFFVYAIHYRHSPLLHPFPRPRLDRQPISSELAASLVFVAEWLWFTPKTGGKYVAFTPCRKIKRKQ